jgi:hypothetical protein
LPPPAKALFKAASVQLAGVPVPTIPAAEAGCTEVMVNVMLTPRRVSRGSHVLVVKVDFPKVLGELNVCTD